MGNWLLLSFILLFCIEGNNCCLEEERKALLELKKEFVHSFLGINTVLTSWIDNPKNDCCFWERVTCNSTNGHVIELSLHSLIQDEGEGVVLKSSANWDQISLFQNFEHLRILNLSFNQLPDWNVTSGYKSFSRLKRLETLDLGGNAFTNNILKSLNLKAFAKLSKLKYVDLSQNQFNNDIMKFLGTLPSLTSVDLSGNNLEGSLTKLEVDELSNLKVLILRDNLLYGFEGSYKNLEILDLKNNSFSVNIPPNIGELSSLKALSLSQNFLGGILSPSLCKLKKLQELDLSHNFFGGVLPSCLNNLTSLKLLDVSDNRFNGAISPSLMSSLKSLEYVDFSQNSFEGFFSFNSTAKYSKLKVVILGMDGRYDTENNTLHIDAGNSGWNSLFQVEILALSNYNLQSIPKFLYSQRRLKAVDLSQNKLKGKFPIWLLGNNVELGVLNLRNNSFDGPLSLPPYIMRNIVWLDISDNNFNGQFPVGLGTIFPNLKYLNCSYNSFEGVLPFSIGRMEDLKMLDLSFNNFKGEVPKELVANCTKLNFLRLSNNKFEGQIFSVHFNLSNLLSLMLDNNDFTGSMTNVDFSLLQQLWELDVSNNKMTGKIPSWITNSTALGVLAMRDNYFEGHFPCEQDSHSLTAVDLSHNLLSGPLPSCFKSDFLQVVNLEGNKFTGSLPMALFNSSISMLNLRSNRLSGSIPNSVGLPNIRILLLGNNDLSGLIPKQLCGLTDISIMDLSNNSFSGSIPSCLNNITFGIKVVGPYYGYLKIAMEGDTISYNYGNYLQRKNVYFSTSIPAEVQFEIDFTTKYLVMPYKDGILTFMSGLDLSSNNLTGRIPWSIGDLSIIRAINVSHNHLVGSIPISLSNLSEIESLDLSYNNLSGEIPFDLTRLYSLGAFSVAHNNLSGKIPDVPQLSTFDESSYEGNPFLCGKPLAKGCNTIDADEPPQSPIAHSVEGEGKWYEVDLVSFLGSLAATYIVVLLGFVTILYINPYWRRRWFYFVENFIDACYYHLVRILH
ncbi:hypothetical protein COLO4_11893 [Corchorus olitorius]|uniref:Leucine-rich repeat-containing N-terminal plant-type domain-containing protein n=1 Tax=Corchorus olitorius TaxID=93759 RepID=A0A1R3K2V4_9ROSI|nr:hypothetical protein COLO4_11893 [Corchorus olitorius]